MSLRGTRWLLLSFLAAGTFSQNQPAGRNLDEQELLRAEKEWYRAYYQSDTAAASGVVIFVIKPERTTLREKVPLFF
jgi:hypothetical protein